jgi:hypothetical protein
MNRATLQMRTLAKKLVGLETPANMSAEANNSTAFRATDKVRTQLSLLMGPAGVEALLARALVLAAAEIPWLTTVRVVPSGELDVTAAEATVNAAGPSEAEVVLLAQLLGLLAAFIGPALTLRLLSQIWRELSLHDADFSQMADNEEAE